jgi:hypothetical protein
LFDQLEGCIARTRAYTKPQADKLAAEIAADSAEAPACVADRIQRRESIKGPREGDWVIMPDGTFARLTSDGIGNFSRWVGSGEEWPIDAVADPKNPNRVWHQCFSSSRYSDDHFYLRGDGSISHSGGNQFNDVPRDTKLVDTGKTKPGLFRAFEVGHPDPDLSKGIDCELDCRVYSIVADSIKEAA